MSNINISTRVTSGIVLLGATFQDETLISASAATWPAGAVLGRVASTGKLVRYDPAADDGSEVPLAVLTTDVEFTAVGDRFERPAISGKLRRGKLVDAAGAELTVAAVDQLRGFTIIALDTYQTSEYDNQ